MISDLRYIASFYTSFIWVSSEFRPNFVWASSVFCPSFVWLSSDFCPSFVQVSFKVSSEFLYKFIQCSLPTQTGQVLEFQLILQYIFILCYVPSRINKVHINFRYSNNCRIVGRVVIYLGMILIRHTTCPRIKAMISLKNCKTSYSRFLKSNHF